jgi:hypothetical protein
MVSLHKLLCLSLTFHGRWLYLLFLGLDANFCLKRKDVSSDKHDNGLSLGWSYFVPNGPYKEHLARYNSETEPVRVSVTTITLALKWFFASF